jgi:hypothetical protein
MTKRLQTIPGILLLLGVSMAAIAQPAPAAIAAFNAYDQAVESRLAQQHRTAQAFLAPSVNTANLRHGDQVIEQIKPSPSINLPGALLHHWRGTAFAPGAKAADFDRVMRDFGAYPQRFASQVLQARTISQAGDRMQAFMRVRQKHVISVVLDTTYDVTFGRLDAQRGYSISRSTQISEIDAPGTRKERTLSPAEEHGFLWRLNTYWSYEERDGGLYLQIETVSLSRAVPAGLGWAVGPYVESIPRESLEFTLRTTCNALRNPSH